MLHLLSLLLPALVPSWRFFKSVGPSPRVQWAADGGVWRDYRPRPDHVSGRATLTRLVWNPLWNDTLFMVSLAERLVVDPTDKTLADIWSRIGDEARAAGVPAQSVVQFRLLFVSREGDQITSEITYQSGLCALDVVI